MMFEDWLSARKESQKSESHVQHDDDVESAAFNIATNISFKCQLIVISETGFERHVCCICCSFFACYE